ncbi:MAG: cation:proton antiporter [Ardenticatenia bacterium]|nr:cation:proton antiporter [Ardenticatenia bacterium]
MRRWSVVALLLVLIFTLLAVPVHAAGGEEGEGTAFAQVFLWIAVLLVAARVAGLVERVRQPPVLGELAVGIVLGNLSLLGIHTFEPLREDAIMRFLAELGVVILLFQIGLESNVHTMRQVGLRALGVALIGVVVPFALGTLVVGPLLLTDASFKTSLFLGAALTATSVGITARVFRDLNYLHHQEAQIVLGAAVIDDVLGLIILAVVSAVVSTGAVDLITVGRITVEAFLFLAGAIVIGQALAPSLSQLFSRIHTGTGMKFTLAISFCLVFAYLAQAIGLAPIVGAFAAGLVLDPVHFRHFADPEIVAEIKAVSRDAPPTLRAHLDHIVAGHVDRHVEDLIEPVGFLLVPLFFVMTGMGVRLDALFTPSTLLLALAITTIAFIGKVVAGVAARPANPWIVGWGMAPRGEVGLIFAAIGRSLGVISEGLFSVIIIMVILTTLLSPPILAFLIRKEQPVAQPAS